MFFADKNKDQISTQILELKKTKNAIILAHYYQNGDVQDIADFVGDSLQLAQEAKKTRADIIVFAGVRFMGEMAKILNPERKVIIPDMEAGCSLADTCEPQRFGEFIRLNPNAAVISYVNCSVEIKAMTDILCTSSNAEKVILSVPRDRDIIFAPDKHLGNYLQKKTGRQMILWDGFCMVHEEFDLQDILDLKTFHPEAAIIAHPECPEIILNKSDFIGSTTSLIEYVKKSPRSEFIVVTEPGVLHKINKESPTKVCYQVRSKTGHCNECKYMKLNTLDKLYLALKNEEPEIRIGLDLCKKALLPLERMLAIV